VGEGRACWPGLGCVGASDVNVPVAPRHRRTAWGCQLGAWPGSLHASSHGPAPAAAADPAALGVTGAWSDVLKFKFCARA
jgi:hypothetical protein